MKSSFKSKIFVTFLLVFFNIYLVSNDEQLIEKQFSAVKSILVQTISGDLELKQSPDTLVHVRITFSFTSGYKTKLEMQGQELQLGETIDRNNTDGQSKFILLIPNGLPVTFISASGTCHAQDLFMDLNVKNASGDIELNRINGKIIVKTASGDLDGTALTGDIYYNGASGNVKLIDSNGTITVKGASSDFWGRGLTGKADISLASGNLTIRDSKLTVQAKTASGDIAVRDVKLDGSSELKTASGTVLLRLSAPLQSDLHIKSATGRITLQLNAHAPNATFICRIEKERGRISSPFNFDSERVIEENGHIFLEKTVKIGNTCCTVIISCNSGDLFIEK